MKKILLVLLLISTTLQAQEVTLKWAEKIPTKGYISILGGKKGKYYTTHVDKKDQIIGRSYDKNMNLVEEKQIAFNLEDKKYGYKGAYFLNTGILHFIYENKRKQDKSLLYTGYSDFNLNTLDKLNIVSEASDDDKVINFGLRSISPDSTKILTYHEREGRRKEPNILVYKVYNASITDILNEGVVSLPIKSKYYTTDDIKVDNLGNVYLLAKITKEKSERVKGNSDYYYKLVVFAKDKTIKEFDFDYPDNNISYIDMIPGKNNTFFCTGFLTNLKGGKKTLISDEMFFAKLDCATLKLGDSKMLKVDGLYPDEIKKSQDFVPYKIRNIYEKSNGGYSIVAEQYKLIITHHTTPNGGTTTHYRYYYCDIACVQTDIKSNVETVTRMPKYQLNAGNPSIISTFKNDKTFIIYEDLLKNLTAEDDKKTKRSSAKIFSSDSKNALFLMSIEPDGKFKKEVIYDYKESKIRPRIQSSLEINPGEILLNADDQLGLLQIN